MTFTLEDYDRLVDGRDDDRRFELVDGQIFAFAGAMPVHNASCFKWRRSWTARSASRAASIPASRRYGSKSGSCT